MTPHDIEQEKQNKPTLIANDFSKQFNIPVDVTYEILLRRGVFKWLGIRRKLIKLKNTRKDRITESIKRQATLSGAKREYERGYRHGLEECRKEVRALCHSSRVQCPDNDKQAARWLERAVSKVKVRSV